MSDPVQTYFDAFQAVMGAFQFDPHEPIAFEDCRDSSWYVGHADNDPQVVEFVVIGNWLHYVPGEFVLHLGEQYTLFCYFEAGDMNTQRAAVLDNTKRLSEWPEARAGDVEFKLE